MMAFKSWREHLEVTGMLSKRELVGENLSKIRRPNITLTWICILESPNWETNIGEHHHSPPLEFLWYSFHCLQTRKFSPHLSHLFPSAPANLKMERIPSNSSWANAHKGDGWLVAVS